MRYFILLLVIATTSACSMNDIVTMDTPTKQNFDLNDQDRDGVIAARERCTGTLTGADIDNYGCGTIKNVNERQDLEILFANNSDFIEPQYYDKIERVAKILTLYPQTKVVIEGHCSNRGSYELNLALSQKRAKAVTQILEDGFGIESDRLTAIGYSFDKPVDTSGTPEAEILNRRVVAEVTGDDTMANMKWHIYTVDEQVE